MSVCVRVRARARMRVRVCAHMRVWGARGSEGEGQQLEDIGRQACYSGGASGRAQGEEVRAHTHTHVHADNHAHMCVCACARTHAQNHGYHHK